MAATGEAAPARPKRRRRAASLEARFTLFVAALLTVLGLLATVLILDADRRASINEMRSVTTRLGEQFAPLLASTIERRDHALVGPMLSAYTRGPHVVSVAVTDMTGTVIAKREGISAVEGRGPVAYVRVPIKTSAGRQVGTLVYTMGTVQVVASGAQGLFAALLGVALFVAAAIPLTWMMVRRATAPLRQLTTFAEQLTAQKLSSRIEIASGDEFETLADAFNHMMARLNAAMRRVQRIAYVDSLTDLPNGDRLMRELAKAIEMSAQMGAPGALFLINIERASRSAESLGQDAARELIVAAAQRLCDAVKSSDPAAACESAPKAAIVARLAASEFAVLYPALPRGVDLQALARALIAAFNEPFTWREHRIAMPSTAGAAFFPRDGREPDEIVRHARLALSAASGDAQRYRFFTRSLDRAASAKMTLEREIRGALDRNEFRAYFQPKVNLRNGRVEGAEALARWLRPDGSIIGPGRFIPAAEEMGLIGPISEAILRDACWKGAAWSREGLAACVAVNVSALQFADDNLPAKVVKIAEQAGLPLQCLELEITESVAMEDVDRALRMIEPLRAAGVRFSIDDFGTGHSSLAALTRLPFGVLKIDQSFVRGLSIDRHSAAIIETILAMAAALDYEVVAEGVETEQEAEFLRRRGCQTAQGFLFSAAQPPVEYLRILREGAIAPRRGEKPAGALDPAA